MSIRLSSEEQEKLILKNLKLVYQIVNKLDISQNDYEDIVSIGTIGLIKAVKTFDDSKNIKFSTYATTCIRNEIFMHFRREKKYSNIVSLEEVINTDNEGNELTLLNMLEDPNGDIAERIENIDIAQRLINIILNLLEPKKRFIMLCRIAGVKQHSIGKILNLSRGYIENLEHQSRNETKAHFTNSQAFKQVFSMKVEEDSYKILFSSEDVKNFNMILASLLENTTSAELLPDFEVSCNNGQIIVKVPAHPESFYFIAQIIKEIDNYTLETKAPKLEGANKEKTAEMVHVAKQVKAYILRKETFTTTELKEKFPEVSATNMAYIVYSIKKNGLIVQISKGKFTIKKD